MTCPVSECSFARADPERVLAAVVAPTVAALRQLIPGTDGRAPTCVPYGFPQPPALLSKRSLALLAEHADLAGTLPAPKVGWSRPTRRWVFPQAWPPRGWPRIDAPATILRRPLAYGLHPRSVTPASTFALHARPGSSAHAPSCSAAASNLAGVGFMGTGHGSSWLRSSHTHLTRTVLGRGSRLRLRRSEP